MSFFTEKKAWRDLERFLGEGDKRCGSCGDLFYGDNCPRCGSYACIQRRKETEEDEDSILAEE